MPRCKGTERRGPVPFSSDFPIAGEGLRLHYPKLKRQATNDSATAEDRVKEPPKSRDGCLPKEFQNKDTPFSAARLEA
jgi:hypothetical protein